MVARAANDDVENFECEEGRRRTAASGIGASAERVREDVFPAGNSGASPKMDRDARRARWRASTRACAPNANVAAFDVISSTRCRRRRCARPGTRCSPSWTQRGVRIGPSAWRTRCSSVHATATPSSSSARASTRWMGSALDVRRRDLDALARDLGVPMHCAARRKAPRRTYDAATANRERARVRDTTREQRNGGASPLGARETSYYVARGGAAVETTPTATTCPATRWNAACVSPPLASPSAPQNDALRAEGAAARADAREEDEAVVARIVTDARIRPGKHAERRKVSLNVALTASAVEPTSARDASSRRARVRGTYVTARGHRTRPTSEGAGDHGGAVALALRAPSPRAAAPPRSANSSNTEAARAATCSDHVSSDFTRDGRARARDEEIRRAKRRRVSFFLPCVLFGDFSALRNLRLRRYRAPPRGIHRVPRRATSSLEKARAARGPAGRRASRGHTRLG